MAPGHVKKVRAPSRVHTTVVDQAPLDPTLVAPSSPRSVSGSQPPTTPIDTNSSIASNRSKRGRGVARGLEVLKRVKSGGKIQGLIFIEGRWLPVGPAEKIFKMELGVVTRLLAPLGIFYWKQMTPAMKMPLFQRLESEFEINFDEPHTKEVVDAAMATHFRQFKYRCHLYYKKFSTQEEAREHPPTNVELVDWIPLCEHFESEKFKSQSKANEQNRSKLEVPHTSGSKSFSQRLYEMENSEITREPTQVNLYYDTHHKRDGTWVHPRAKENYERMETLFSQPIVEGNTELTEDQIREEVLGRTKSGYARGLGYRMKSSRSTASEGAARIQAQRAEEAERRAQKYCDEVQELRQSQSNLQELVQTLLARLDGTRAFDSLQDRCNI